MEVKNPSLLFRNIRVARTQAGLSQKELAKKLKVSDKTVSAYETGRAIPPTKILPKISTVTGTSLSTLLGVQEKRGEGALFRKLERIEKRISYLGLGYNYPKMIDKYLFVGIVLKDKNNRIYLIKEKDKHMITKERWNLPGGSVDDGEGFIESATREAREKTGYNIMVTSTLGCYRCKKGENSWIYIVFGAEPLNHKRKATDPGVKEGKWFEREYFLKMDSSELVHPDMKLVYNIATSQRGLSTESVKYIDYDLQ